MGQTFHLEDSARKPVADGGSSEVPVIGGAQRSENHIRLAAYRDEVAVARRWLTTLEQEDTSVVMRKLSSQHARLREIQADLWDMNAFQPAQHFRSRQVEPLLSDTMIHFQLHSRALASMQTEWEIARGQ